MKIRKYQADDKVKCQRICLETFRGSRTPKKDRILLLLYNDYYLENEPDNTFVLAENENIYGYILTSESFGKYEKVFRSDYLPALKKVSFFQYLLKKFSLRTERKIASEYPAHLHIDILSPHTGSGYGSEMMPLALDSLGKKGVKGIFLGVGANNTKAVNFYLKHGFIPIRRLPSVIYMAKKL